MKKITFLLTFLIVLNGFILTAQSSNYTLNTTGGSAAISGNIYEWSIGEMVLVNTVSTKNLIVSQGLLQNANNEVGSISAELNNLQLMVYPNPTVDFLLVQTKLPANTQLDIAIYDITGRLVQKKEYHLISDNEVQQIDFNPFSSGIYMLEVNTLVNGISYKNTFKIQNNK